MYKDPAWRPQERTKDDEAEGYHDESKAAGELCLRSEVANADRGDGGGDEVPAVDVRPLAVGDARVQIRHGPEPAKQEKD